MSSELHGPILLAVTLLTIYDDNTHVVCPHHSQTYVLTGWRQAGKRVDTE